MFMQDKVIDGKYIVGDLIGQGSYGYVYKGKNKDSCNQVAIKVDDDAPEQLKNEYIIYSKLTGSLGIPQILWYGTVEGNGVLVMQLLGSSLYQKLVGKTEYSYNDIKRFGVQLLSILEVTHNNGIVHNDIKLDNILLDLNNKQLYFIDFGLAVDKTREHTKTWSPKEDLLNLGYALLSLINKKPIERSSTEIKLDVANVARRCHFSIEALENYFVFCESLDLDEIADFEALKSLLNYE